MATLVTAVRPGRRRNRRHREGPAHRRARVPVRLPFVGAGATSLTRRYIDGRLVLRLQDAHRARTSWAAQAGASRGPRTPETGSEAQEILETDDDASAAAALELGCVPDLVGVVSSASVSTWTAYRIAPNPWRTCSSGSRGRAGRGPLRPRATGRGTRLLVARRGSPNRRSGRCPTRPQQLHGVDRCVRATKGFRFVGLDGERPIGRASPSIIVPSCDAGERALPVRASSCSAARVPSKATRSRF